MYISRRFETNICATIHLKALQELYKENLYIVDLRTEGIKKISDRRINLGVMSKKEKVLRTLELNTWYLTNERINTICNIIERKNIKKIFIDESAFGKLVRKIKKKFPEVVVVTFYHDIGKILYSQWLKNKGIKYLPDYIGSMYGEKLNQKYSDCNLVLNQRDYKVFEKVYHKKPEGLLPAAVEEPDFSLIKAVEFDFSKKGDKDRYILFVGSKYYPNIVGLSWFVKNVFLNLSDKFKLIVIGRGMECVREDYKDNNRIFIVGGVKFLAPFYNNADIVIAPLFDGGGMKQKTAEALAYGKTFVGTKESLYGYEDALQVNHNGEKIVFSEDSAEEQVKIFELIDKKNLYGRYKKLTDLFKDNYSKDAIKNRLLEILK